MRAFVRRMRAQARRFGVLCGTAGPQSLPHRVRDESAIRATARKERAV